MKIEGHACLIVHFWKHFIDKTRWRLSKTADGLEQLELYSEEQYSGPGNWYDPDSLKIGNGPLDGTNAGTNPAEFFTQNQRQTVMSWWAITAAPLILRTDLTSNIDGFDYTLLQCRDPLF